VLVIGLTGGIGSGKSTVARLLAAEGAVIIEADRLGREVVEPDGPAYGPLWDRFGAEYFLADGGLDRRALAGLVFADPVALADLNAITHPAIRALIAERLARLRADPVAPAAAVVEVPLVGLGSKADLGLDMLIGVDTTFEVALQRLTTQRGMTAEDALARMNAQAERSTGVLADVVITNDGSPEELAAQVRSVWEQVVTPRQ
jgi:dephospho-CoA kinase